MKIRTLLLSSLLLMSFSSVAHAEPERIPLQVRENIRVVYQVSDDKHHEGVNRAMFYARKLINAYEKQGIDTEQVHLHLVYHSSSIVALLNEDGRKRLGAEQVKNPNTEILAELFKLGVQIEICEDTMRQKEVTPGELLDGVKMVVGAFPRIIDLQLQGYAYIKFE